MEIQSENRPFYAPPNRTARKASPQGFFPIRILPRTGRKRDARAGTRASCYGEGAGGLGSEVDLVAGTTDAPPSGFAGGSDLNPGRLRPDTTEVIAVRGHDDRLTGWPDVPQLEPTIPGKDIVARRHGVPEVDHQGRTGDVDARQALVGDRRVRNRQAPVAGTEESSPDCSVVSSKQVKHR